MATCEAVIFDLGRVLIDYDWHIALKGLQKWTRMSEEEAERRILAMDGVFRFETGKLDERAFHAHVEEAVQAKIPFPDFEVLWDSIFTGEIERVARVARAIMADGRVKLAVLSNTNAMHVRFLRRTWPLMNQLTNVFLSNEIGYRKPDPSAFQHVLDRIGTKAEATLMVDDLERNIQAAKALGMLTLHVTSLEQAVKELATYGLVADGKGTQG